MLDAQMTDLETFARCLHTRVCPLYRKERKRAFLVGTGIPLTSASGDYVITASHVLDELPDNIVITAGTKSLLHFQARSISYGYVDGETVDADVGVVRLPVEAARDLSSRYRFTTPEEFGVVAEYDKFTLYAFVGYPHTRNKPKPVALPELRATPTFLILREFSDVAPFVSSGKRPEVHFALQAPLDKAKDFDSQAVALPKLQGMSGGGVWRVDIDRRDGTLASVALVGVGIEYRPTESTIVATRIQYVLGLLKNELWAPKLVGTTGI